MTSVNGTARNRKPAVTDTPPPDIRVSNHGSVFLFAPTSGDILDLLLDLIPPGRDHHYFGCALVVEWRYADAVAEQLREDGLSVA